MNHTGIEIFFSIKKRRRIYLRKKPNIIVMGVMVLLTLALVLTGCGKKEPAKEEVYDEYTGQVWVATKDDGRSYILEFWPDKACFLIRTEGERWTGATKRFYEIKADGELNIDGGYFPATFSDGKKVLTIIMPDGESWDFKPTDNKLSNIDETLDQYDTIFVRIDVNFPVDNSDKLAPGSDNKIKPNANGKYEYTIALGTYTLECDINIWDYIDSDNNFDLIKMLEDWGFDSIDIVLNNSGGTAWSSTREIKFIFSYDDRTYMNDYQLRPLTYWQLVSYNFWVINGINTIEEAKYAVTGYSPWGMSEDEIAMLAYCVEYGTENPDDAHYMVDFKDTLPARNKYYLP